MTAQYGPAPISPWMANRPGRQFCSCAQANKKMAQTDFRSCRRSRAGGLAGGRDVTPPLDGEAAAAANRHGYHASQAGVARRQGLARQIVVSPAGRIAGGASDRL